MLIDTHCHLDAPELAQDIAQWVQGAHAQGVQGIVIPAVARANFDAVRDLAGQYAHCVYALGIHPLYISQSQPEDLEWLKMQLQSGLSSTHPPVAVGEIGLDFFVSRDNAEQQTWFFVEQLRIANHLGLPVILHLRAAVDEVLKCLRKHPVCGGIAHAFNGSLQQAEQFIALGFKLGFGGAMTYSRALKIRALAQELPIEALVLETDAPDIPPAWLGHRGLNTPEQLPKIAHVLAQLRRVELAEIAHQTGLNARFALPGTAHLFT